MKEKKEACRSRKTPKKIISFFVSVHEFLFRRSFVKRVSHFSLFFSPCSRRHISITDEGFTSNTLRSAHSHVTEVSSVMTANVSDSPAASGAGGGGGGGSGGGGVDPLVPSNTPSTPTHSRVAPTHQTNCQMSPPQPVSTLQHNYSNIQQPAPLVSLSHTSSVSHQ